MRPWWTDLASINELADWLRDQGELNTPESVLGLYADPDFHDSAAEHVHEMLAAQESLIGAAMAREDAARADDDPIAIDAAMRAVAQHRRCWDLMHAWQIP